MTHIPSPKCLPVMVDLHNDGQPYTVENVGEARGAVIELRNTALELNDFERTIKLSHAIDLLTRVRDGLNERTRTMTDDSNKLSEPNDLLDYGLPNEGRVWSEEEIQRLLGDIANTLRKPPAERLAADTQRSREVPFREKLRVLFFDTAWSIHGGREDCLPVGVMHSQLFGSRNVGVYTLCNLNTPGCLSSDSTAIINRVIVQTWADGGGAQRLLNMVEGSVFVEPQVGTRPLGPRPLVPSEGYKLPEPYTVSETGSRWYTFDIEPTPVPARQSFSCALRVTPELLDQLQTFHVFKGKSVFRVFFDCELTRDIL